MTDYNKDLSILVLSCDKYSDLWNDFFNLKDKYWNDTTVRWYLVTETKIFKREGVSPITCGCDQNWAARFRKAVNLVDTPFIGIFLDDYFITDPIDIDYVMNLISFMKEHDVTYLNVGDVFKSIIGMKNKEYFSNGLIKIPNHKRYGISTVSAIWERNFLLSKLGDGDYSAWQFEIDRCEEAKSKEGLGGLLLCDEKRSFNVSEIPVVIQGRFYPKSIKFFKNRGYNIDVTHRGLMSFKQVILYNLKIKFSRIRFMRKQVKWLASNLLGVKFFNLD